MASQHPPASAPWTERGKIACPCCGAMYRLDVMPIAERRDGFAKCESCDTLIDEWFCAEARRYERLDSGQPLDAAKPSAPRPAAAGDRPQAAPQA